MMDKKQIPPRGQQANKPAKSSRPLDDARQESGNFQPHNAKKEGLGPNTKR